MSELEATPREAVELRADPVPDEPTSAFTLAELRGALLRPYRLFEHVLGSRERLMRTVVERRNLPLLVLLLFASSVVTALPYGAVPPVSGFWKIAVLFTGSTLICFPSLFVFGQYLGFRLTLPQTLAVAIVVATTAGMFSFGFFPIVWFVAATTTESSASASALSGLLLTLALLLGICHLMRCLWSSRQLAPTGGHFLVFLAWAVLLIFITYRMALTIGVAS